MKIEYSNFVHTGTTSVKDGMFTKKTHHADVDVTITTGALFWKKTKIETIAVYRAFADFWRYADTGDLADNKVSNLASAYSAKHGIEL